MLAILDPKTLGIAYAILLLTLAGMMVFVLRTRKTYAGFTHWTTFNALLAAGALLLILRAVLPGWLGIGVGNYLVLLALALFYDGLTLFHGRKLSWRRNGTVHVAAVACALMLLYFLYADPNRNARIICVNLFRAALMFALLANIMRHGHNPVYKLLAAVVIGSLGMAGFRILHALTSEPLTDLFLEDMMVRLQLLVDAALSFFATFCVILLTQMRLEEELQDARQSAERASRTDSLTGLWNRYHFEGEARREMERAKRYGHPCSVFLFDIDHFKQVNDNYGHLVGDQVLRELAGRTREAMRASDLVCRWGGEEFIVLLPAGVDAAMAAAEKLRREVAETPFTTVGTVTISVGAAQLQQQDDLASWTLRADQALYRAKARGRNRVEREAGSDNRVSPLSLQWNAGFSSGDPVIDSQHKALFEKANLLLERCAAEDLPGVRQLMKVFLEETNRHFAYEEAVLATMGYPQLEAHRREHNRLRERGRKLLAAASGSGETGDILSDLSAFVVRELALGHIAEEDVRYVETIQGQRVA